MSIICPSRTMQSVVQASERWLLSQYDEAGHGWGERLGCHVNCLNTAEVILGLMDAGVNPRHEKIQAATKYLLQQQIKNGLDDGSWGRLSGEGTAIPDIYRTALVLQALMRATPAEKAIDKGLRWIRGRQNEDGGWGFARGQATALVPTCAALSCLVIAFGNGETGLSSTIAMGLKCLRHNFVNPGGSIGRTHIIYPHTVQAALLLQAVVDCPQLGSFGIPMNEVQVDLDNAIQWLLQNQAQSQNIFEEDFTVDPNPHGSGNYRFRHMTEAYLLQLVTQHVSSNQVQVDLLHTIAEKSDPGGGFYGHRALTWATARVLSGLQTAAKLYREFPPSQPVSPPKLAYPPITQLIGFGIVVMVLFALTIAALVGRLDPILAVSLFGLLLVVLVIADKVQGWYFLKFLTDVVKVRFGVPDAPAPPKA